MAFSRTTPTKSTTSTTTKAPTRPSKPTAAGASTATRRKPPVKFTYKAPAGVTSFFVYLSLSTAKDGFIKPGSVAAELIHGRWDNDRAATYDMLVEDQQSVIALVSRLNMLMYAPNPARRFPSNTAYEILIRASVTRDGLLRTGVKHIWTTPKGKTEMSELVDKTDQSYRKIRRAGKFLAGALTSMVSLVDLKEAAKESMKEEKLAQREALKEERLAAREAAREERKASRDSDKAARKSSRGGRVNREAAARARR